jgi:hypothetical protein
MKKILLTLGILIVSSSEVYAATNLPPGIPFSAIGNSVAPLVNGLIPTIFLPTAVIQAVGPTLSLSGSTVNLPAVNTSGAGTFTNLTVDSYGRITAIHAITAAQITSALGFTPVQIGIISGTARDALAGINAEITAQTTANNALAKSNNLSDLTNLPTARTNLFGYAVALGGTLLTSGTVSLGNNFTTTGPVSLGGSFTTSGNAALTFITTAATNVTLPTSGTLLNSTNINLTTDNTSGTYAIVNDSFICVNKTVAAINSVTLPASPIAGREVEVKDCAGNSAAYPISIIPASGLVDGQSSAVINTNFEALRFIYNGSQWGIW